MIRHCNKCNQDKSINNFGTHVRKLKNGDLKQYFNCYCKSCRVKYNNENFKKSGNKRCKEKQKDYKLKSKYGINLQDFNDQLKHQDYKCAICKEHFKDERHIHVDHCHTSNNVRGILCTLCNTSLGGFKDNINALKNAIKYLESKGSWSRAVKSEKVAKEAVISI